jgi:hypothetical protein
MKDIVTSIICAALVAVSASSQDALRPGMSRQAETGMAGKGAQNGGAVTRVTECRELEKSVACLSSIDGAIKLECTPLMRAAVSGHLDTVLALLKRGVDVNENGDLGFTALMLAAAEGNLEIAKALLDAGANPNAAYGIAHVGAWSPLTLAINRCNENRLAMVDLLIAGGAKIDPVNRFRINPLESAIVDDDVPMVKALLTRGADVNSKSLIRETPLVDTPLVEAVSVARPDVEIVRVLLEAGADPNLPMLWVGEEYVSLLSYLDGWLKGPEGGERVKDRAREEIVRMLEQAGAKRVRTPAQRDEDRTPTPDNGMQRPRN